jgi:hypothetical protein
MAHLEVAMAVALPVDTVEMRHKARQVGAAGLHDEVK